MRLPSYALGLLVGLLGCSSRGSTDTGRSDPRPRATLVPTENARPGDGSWVIDAGAGGGVAGYGSKITLHAGDVLDVAVSVPSPQAFTWKAFRMGWYGGAGGRLVAQGGPLPASPQVPCPRDPVTSRVECAWPPAFQLQVPAGALSGVYLIKLETRGAASYVPFVVHDGRTADFVLDVNVTSWQAYNEFGGESLYADASGTMPTGKAWEVSYDRPFANDNGAGRYLDWEVWFVQFAEALGYDVTYTTAFDIEADPAQLAAARAFVSVANDEYWTVAQRRAVEAARDRGVNLAFFGADQALWRARLQPARDGRPDRVIACYKDAQDRDPVLASQGPAASTARFRDPPAAQPENALIGVGYASWMLLPQAWVVSDPAHWAFAGTGLATGDGLPGLVSAEFDTRLANGAEPPGLRVLSSSPVVDAQGYPLVANATWYATPSGAEVFSVGSIGWPDGLGRTPWANPRVARITRNVLDRYAGAGHEGSPDPADAPWTRQGSAEAVIGEWAPSVTTIAAGDPFAGPGGIAVAPDGAIFVADPMANAILRVSGGQVARWAGTGIDGSIDGPGAAARFRNPVGLALDADGTLYVADAGNNIIRAVAPDAAHTVSTYAGVPSPGGGWKDGPGAIALFNRPVSVAVAPGGLLVADMHNSRIRAVARDAAHTVSTLAGAGAGAPFDYPTAVTVAPDGSIYAIDTYFHAIRRVNDDGTTTLLVGGRDTALGLLADGPGDEARISAEGGLLWAAGRLFFTDTANHRLRALVPGATLQATRVSTLAGNGRAALADGRGDLASFALPLALALGPDGALYVADAGNRAIRKVTLP